MLNTQLLLESVQTPGVLSAKLLIPQGSGHDQIGVRGAHQLLASLLTRGCGPYDHNAIADLVEGCGAGLRSDAHEDGLLISLRCCSDDAPKLIPILDWMVNDPHLRDDQLQLERSLSLQTLQRQQEDPFQLAFDSWRHLAYGDGGYGHDALGLSDELKTLDLPVLQPIHRQLQQSRSVLAIAGQWPAALEQQLTDIVRPVDTLDSKAAQGQFAAARDVPDQTIHLDAIETEQVVMMLGQPSLPHSHPDALGLRLLQCHLGFGMSSLLFRRLREDHGVAYDVGIHHPNRLGAAPFVLHASSGTDKATLALALLREIWTGLREEPLSDNDLELARAKFVGQLAHSRQTCSQRAERRAQLSRFGLPDSHDQDCLERIQAIDAGELRRIAQDLLTAPKLSLCGPQPLLNKLAAAWNG
ncbi:M16 family metallopeptidase [Parasynechococcus sp.]|uniref:M16 family metallopeptidase n=1 Tax=Parasynechococcus sp. TaxID=3101203 RepID=UPI003704D160